MKLIIHAFVAGSMLGLGDVFIDLFVDLFVGEWRNTERQYTKLNNGSKQTKYTQ